MFMKRLRRLLSRQAAAPGPPESGAQAVIVTLAGAELSASVFEAQDLAGLEDRLIAVVESQGLGEFDGNLIGPEAIILYLYGPDAERLYAGIEPILRQHPLGRGARVLIRPGGPDVAGREVQL